MPNGSLEDRVVRGLPAPEHELTAKGVASGLAQPTRGHPFSLAEKTRFARDAAAGIANLHEGGVVHRDIATRNCLLGADMQGMRNACAMWLQ